MYVCIVVSMFQRLQRHRRQNRTIEKFRTSCANFPFAHATQRSGKKNEH